MTTAPRPLVHTRTTAYRHDSVPAGLGALPALDGLAADATEGPAAPEAPLDGCGAVVFLSTSGEIPTPSGRARLAACVEAGGGFARVHAAARTEDDWPPTGPCAGPASTPTPPPAGERPRRGRRPPGTGHPCGRAPTSGTASAATRAAPSSPAPTGPRTRAAGTGADHPLVRCRERGPGRVLSTAPAHTAASCAAPPSGSTRAAASAGPPGPAERPGGRSGHGTFPSGRSRARAGEYPGGPAVLWKSPERERGEGLVGR
ncbi:ThuA domain-containing protein [Streptomyces sp. SCSIO 75703]|uniref:ThuA domain-containing protein n=1 Tax=Streptomyces sp. SCSIO 75703 TaxID=3112165 RepID=UPI0030CB37A9